jgi:hypothetical protein
MALIPDSFQFTEQEASYLEVLKTRAKARHEQARKEAKRRGRHDFPMLPYECSWAFEEKYRKVCRGLLPDTVLG